jgi:uncharacterized protein (DUF2336 family)
MHDSCYQKCQKSHLLQEQLSTSQMETRIFSQMLVPNSHEKKGKRLEEHPLLKQMHPRLGALSGSARHSVHPKQHERGNSRLMGALRMSGYRYQPLVAGLLLRPRAACAAQQVALCPL